MSSVPKEQRHRDRRAPAPHSTHPPSAPTETIGAVAPVSPVANEARLGRYRLVQQLGEGGMGIVYLALDERGRAVAIKVLRDHVAHDPVARARLAREVDTLQRVRHPRVAPVLDAETDGARPYIVTRYVPGDPLDQWVAAHGPLAADGLARLGRGLAEALGAIHTAGVVHRDLKPANVLMARGDPVVIDFGIAHVADDVRLTHTGLVMGTPGFLSPELLDGHPVDDSTDWFAWAATLLFAATGRAPFGTGPVEAVLARVRRGEADLRGVDERLRPVLLAGLRPEAGDRPRQEDILAALDVFVGGGDTASIVGATPTRTQSPLAAEEHWGAGRGTAADPEATRPVPAPHADLSPTAAHPWAAGSPMSPAPASSSARSARSVGSVRPAEPLDPDRPVRAERPGWTARASAATRGLFGAVSGTATENTPAGRAPETSSATRPQPVVNTRVMPAVGPGTDSSLGASPGAPGDRASRPASPQPYVGFRAEATAAPPPGGLNEGYHPLPRPAPGRGYPGRPFSVAPPAPSGPRLRHRVQLPLVALLAALTGLAMSFPVVAVLGAAAWSVVARTVDASASALAAGAAERGPRRSDLVLAFLGSPLWAIPAVVTTLMVMLVSGVVAAGAAVGAAALLTESTGTTLTMESEPVLAIALVVGVLVGWWGPAGSNLRRGSRRTMRALTLGRAGALVVTVALMLLGSYFAVRSQASGVVPDWYPFTQSLLAGWLGSF